MSSEAVAPRPEKVAVVAEVKEKLSSSEAVLVTEYRGLSVKGITDVRRSVRSAGGEYRVYKNTLVRRAVDELGLDVADLLVGPTALAFVRDGADGVRADAVGVAKALTAFAQTNDKLVLKGGLLGTRVLSSADVAALAKTAPREELLARLAGGFAAPMRNMAALLAAVPLKFAYALQALIEAGGASGAPAPAPTPALADEPASTDTPEEESNG